MFRRKGGATETGVNDLLGQLLHALDAAVLIVSAGGEVLLATDTALSSLGLERPPSRLPSPEALPVDDAGAPVPPDRLPWAQALAERHPVSALVRFKVGEAVRDIVATCAPLDGSEPLGVAVRLAPAAHGVTVSLGDVQIDPTEMADVLGRMPLGLIVTANDGRVLFTNAETDRIWRSEARGTGYVCEGRVGLHQDGRPYAGDEWPLRRALGGEVVRGERIEIVRGDETHGWLDVSAAPLCDRHGRMAGAVGVMLDVTERVLAEQLSEALSGIAELAASAPPAEDLIAGILERAMPAMRADAALFLERTSSGAWSIRVSRGMDELPPNAAVVPEAGAELTRLLEAGEAFVSTDFLDDRRSAWLDPARYRLRSAVGAAINAQGRPAGILIFAFERPGGFSDAHVSFAKKLAKTTSLALESGTLTVSLLAELRRTRLLRMVAQTATTTSDLGVACRRILKALARELGMRVGFICVADNGGGGLRLCAKLGLGEEGEGVASEWACCTEDGLPMTREVYRTGRTLTHEDWTSTEATRGFERSLDLEQDRFASVPIHFRRRTEGVLHVQFEGRRPFTREEIALFETVAHTVGQAIENTRLLRAEKDARDEAAAELELSNVLLETSERLGAALETSEALDALVDSLVKVTGRERVLVALYQRRDDEFVVAAVRGTAHGRVGDRWSSKQLPGDLRALLRDRRVRECDFAENGGEDLGEGGSPPHAGVRGLMMPLVSQDQLVGVVMAPETPGSPPLTKREMRLLEGIATQAAVVIHNASLYDTQHRIAETLQEAMLVMPEHVQGIRYGTMYRSATTAARVGGDFYDLFELCDGKVAIVVGDVSGKGVDAASVTALARTTFRIHAAEGYSPSMVMAKTNAALLRFTSSSTFVTAFYGVLDVASGALVYVIAGHPDGFVVGPNGYVQPLAGQSALLGVLEEPRYEERFTMLAPADTVFLYTDGVTEARRGRELYGTGRLAAFLSTVPENDPRLIPGAVLREVSAFAGGMLRDDIAMLAVSREATADT